MSKRRRAYPPEFRRQMVEYASLGVTVLGDDVYCHEEVLAQGFEFILACKPSRIITGHIIRRQTMGAVGLN